MLDIDLERGTMNPISQLERFYAVTTGFDQM